jgi:FAS-associated factor 2
MEEDGTTNDQMDKILQFQELTGIEDINIVRDILIRHQWNLEIAFQEQERMNEGEPSLYVSTVDQRAPTVINDRFLQHIFVSNRSNNNNGDAGSGMFGLFSYVVNSILNWCLSTASAFIQTLFSVFTERERSKFSYSSF